MNARERVHRYASLQEVMCSVFGVVLPFDETVNAICCSVKVFRFIVGSFWKLKCFIDKNMDVRLSCLVIFVRSIIGSLRMLEGFLLEQIWTFRKGCKFWHRIVAVCGAHFFNLSHVQNALAICKDFRWPCAQVSSSVSHSVTCGLLKRTCGWRPQVRKSS